MSELNFALTLFIAITGPILAISYLRPILVPVLDALCVEPMPGAIGAHFWLRSAYVLAVAGTLVLSLLFGEFQGEPLAAVHRALLLAAGGCFISIALITRRVWAPVQARLTKPPATACVPVAAATAASDRWV
jgi:hypothetical protein